MEEKEKKRKSQLWTVHRYTEGHSMGDICYGRTCLVVEIYSSIQKEREKTRTTTKYTPHLKKEREIKRVRGGVGVE